MYLLNGKKINIQAPYTAPDGVRYPNLLSPELRAALGVVELPDPVRPDETWYLIAENPDGTLNVWPRPVEQLVPMVSRRIEQIRDEACVADVTVYDRPWQADARSQQLLANAILLAQAGTYVPTVWRDANNADMAISDLSQLVAIAGAIAAQTQAAYALSWQRKAALAACRNMEEVKALYEGLM